MIGPAKTAEEREALAKELAVTVDLLVQNMLQPELHGLEAKKDA
jgi:hypothetical protein